MEEKERKPINWSVVIELAYSTPTPKLIAGDRASVARQMLAVFGMEEPDYTLPYLLSVWYADMVATDFPFDEHPKHMTAMFIAAYIYLQNTQYHQKQMHGMGARYHIPTL